VDRSQEGKQKSPGSSLALMVEGHALKSIMKIKSEDPREAWTTKMKREHEPSKMVDAVHLCVCPSVSWFLKGQSTLVTGKLGTAFFHGVWGRPVP
jgi:hypothetical protein